MLELLATHKRTGLTFAPEAGSERLRRVINKNISQEDLIKTATAAFDRGWTTLKLYFMLGLPTETIADIEEIIQLVSEVYAVGRDVPGKRPQLRVSLATFIPKPHTPFQWVAQESEEELIAKHQFLVPKLRKKGIKLSWHDPKSSLLEAALSRGDRRLSKVIYRAWQLGATFDAWNEYFNYEHWQRAFGDAGLDPDFYARRERPFNEILPWTHINAGVNTDFLKREYQHALDGNPTPDCRNQACQSCGLEQSQSGCQQKLLSS
jgi:radical SAM superfamily enzyme YgiQ (UPF0313 family)